MTPLQDNITAILVAIPWLVVGLIMWLRAAADGDHVLSWVITGAAAIMTGAIYTVPVLFGVPVLEIREALRFSLVAFTVNYIILYRHRAGAWLVILYRKLKTWNSHRS